MMEPKSELVQSNRVFQLESYSLNREIDKIIDQLVDNLSLTRLSEETKLLMKLYIHGHHLKQNTTIGMKAFNLSYHEKNSLGTLTESNPKSYKLLILSICNLIFPYLLRRQRYVQDIINSSLLGKMKLPWLNLDNLSLLVKSIGLLNFMVFLFDGKQLLLQERLLGLVPALMRKDYYTNMSINKIQMELLNRETVWNSLANFLAVVIPHINIEKIKNQALKITNLGPKLANDLGKVSSDKQEIDKCAICQKQPFNPYVIGCRHVFCYYCLYSNHLSDTSQGYTCLLCKYQTMDDVQVRKLNMNN